MTHSRSWLQVKEKEGFKVIVPEAGGTYVDEKKLRKVIMRIMWFYGYLAGSSLGTLGSLKMSYDKYGDVVPTHKVYKIIESISRENPIVEIIWEHSRTLWRNYGDGVKTSLVLAYKLYERALKLIEDGLRPSEIVDGYLDALKVHLSVLNRLSENAGTVPCEVALRGLFSASPLRNLLSKAFCNVISMCNNTYVSECIDVERIEGGNIYDSFVFNGVVVRKTPSRLAMPRVLSNVRVAVLDSKIYVNLKGENVRFIIKDLSTLERFKDTIKREGKKLVRKLKDLNVKLLINLKGIDPVIEEMLERNGVVVVKRIPEDKFKLLIRSSKAKVVGDIKDLSEDKLGKIELMEERVFGDRRYTFLKANGEVITVVLRGPWYHIDTLYDEIRMASRAAEVYRSNPRVLPAGGAPEVEAAIKINSMAKRYGTKKQLAFEAYSQAIKIIPETLARHSGLDPVEAITELEKLHYEGNWAAGVNEEKRSIDADVVKSGLVDIFEIRRKAVEMGVRLAVTLLRISGIYVSKKGEKLRKIRYEG